MKNTALVSALIYTGISLAGAFAFFAATTAMQYDLVARVGGSAWVFLLLMIILMPVSTPLVKKKAAIKPAE